MCALIHRIHISPCMLAHSCTQKNIHLCTHIHIRACICCVCECGMHYKKYNPKTPHTLLVTIVQLYNYVRIKVFQRDRSPSSLQGYRIHSGIMFYSSAVAITDV